MENKHFFTKFTKSALCGRVLARDILTSSYSNSVLGRS